MLFARIPEPISHGYSSVVYLWNACIVVREYALCHHLVAACLIAVPILPVGSAVQDRKPSVLPFLLLWVGSLKAHQALAEELLGWVHEHSCSFDFQIRLRCQKGIPPSLRGRAWQYLSGGKVKLHQNPGKFDVSFPFFLHQPVVSLG